MIVTHIMDEAEYLCDRGLMPPGVQEFANWLPLTHVVHLLQGVWLDGAWNTLSALILLGVLAIGTAVSTATFRWE